MAYYKTDLAGFENSYFGPKYVNGVITLSAMDNAKKMIKRITGAAVYGNLQPISGTPSPSLKLEGDKPSTKEQAAIANPNQSA